MGHPRPSDGFPVGFLEPHRLARLWKPPKIYDTPRLRAGSFLGVPSSFSGQLRAEELSAAEAELGAGARSRAPVLGPWSGFLLLFSSLFFSIFSSSAFQKNVSPQ